MSKDPKLGFYVIKDKIYWDKATALMEATKLNVNFDDVKWNFNDEVFGRYDWSVEPPGDLRFYYQTRAKQLREKYDYIILNLSGGSDSATALYSFIQSELFVDEVVVRHAGMGAKLFGYNHLNYFPENEFSEFEFAAKPLLKWLQTVSPKTKITIHDFSKDIIDQNLVWDENFIHWTGDYVTPGCIVRYNHVTNSDHLKNFDKGKKIGIIFGVDKPRVTFQQEDVNVIFLDRPVHIAQPATVSSGYTNQTVELFYWSPDLPELVIKQCHTIKKWFEHPMNQNLSYMLNFWWQTSPINRSAYEACIKPVIYPDYDCRTFQTNKPSTAMFQEWDYWLLSHKESQGYKTFMRGMKHLYKNIDNEFLRIKDNVKKPGIEMDSDNWEYRTCISKQYFLGKFNKHHLK
jgi:hypothetical protein